MIEKEIKEFFYNLYKKNNKQLNKINKRFYDGPAHGPGPSLLIFDTLRQNHDELFHRRTQKDRRPDRAAGADEEWPEMARSRSGGSQRPSRAWLRSRAPS